MAESSILFLPQIAQGVFCSYPVGRTTRLVRPRFELTLRRTQCAPLYVCDTLGVQFIHVLLMKFDDKYVDSGAFQPIKQGGGEGRGVTFMAFGRQYVSTRCCRRRLQFQATCVLGETLLSNRQGTRTVMEWISDTCTSL